MSTFTELLAEHMPYVSEHRDGALCMKCVDAAGNGHGEFDSAAAWADHVESELRSAGLAVTPRKPAAAPVQASLDLFDQADV